MSLMGRSGQRQQRAVPDMERSGGVHCVSSPRWESEATPGRHSPACQESAPASAAYTIGASGRQLLPSHSRGSSDEKAALGGFHWRFPISYFNRVLRTREATAVRPGSPQFVERDGHRWIVENRLDPRKALRIVPHSLLGLGESFIAIANRGCAVGGGQLGRFRRSNSR